MHLLEIGPAGGINEGDDARHGDGLEQARYSLTRPFTVNDRAEPFHQSDCKNMRLDTRFGAAVADNLLPSLCLLEPPAEKIVKEDKSEADEKRRQELQDRLETKYGVKFSKDGEKLWCEESYRKVECRAPKLRELEVLASVLHNAEPSHRTADGGVKVNFLTENANKIHNHIAFYEKGQIFIEPTAQNYKFLWQEEAYTHSLAGKGDSLEAILTHELAHNSQENMGWSLSDSKSDKMIELGKQYGFKLQQGLWFYEAKTTTDGQHDLFHYKPDLYDGKPDCKPWMRCDRRGLPLNAQGEPVHISKAEFIGVEEMRNRAKVKPATWYAVAPWEADAEARTCLQLNRESRARLLTECPDVYAIAKDEDQQEIDKAYGRVEMGPDKGLSTYLRGLDGGLKPNTAAAREQISQWEKEQRRKSDN